MIALNIAALRCVENIFWYQPDVEKGVGKAHPPAPFPPPALAAVALYISVSATTMHELLTTNTATTPR